MRLLSPQSLDVLGSPHALRCPRLQLLGALHSHPADGVLLDLHMPEVTGFNLLEALAEHQVTTPLVAIDGQTEAGTAGRVLALGASACLTKLVDLALLVGAIRAASARAARNGST